MPSQKNTIRTDPTRTAMLRRQFLADVARRFAALRKAIWDLVVTEDAFGLAAAAARPPLPPPAGPAATQHAIPLDRVLNARVALGPTWADVGRLTYNTRWQFETDKGKLDKYREWLKEKTDAGILAVDPANAAQPWTQPYIHSAYKKGMLRSYSDVMRGAPIPHVEGGREAFMRMAFDSPVAQGKLELLGTRAFSQLQGVTAQMDQEMSRILAQGLADGRGAADLARELQKNVTTLEKKRARAIARSEVVHAHAEGQLDSFEAMNIEEVGVMAEWSTAADSEVCEECAPLEGVVLTISEARGMLPRHPN